MEMIVFDLLTHGLSCLSPCFACYKIPLEYILLAPPSCYSCVLAYYGLDEYRRVYLLRAEKLIDTLIS